MLASLTMIMPTLMRWLHQKTEMLARYARNVWGVAEPDDRRAAEEGIERTEAFFVGMGCPVRASDIGLTIDADGIVEHLNHVGHTALGENKDIGAAEVRAVLSQAA